MYHTHNIRVDVPPPNATDSVYAAFINASGCSSTPTLDCLRGVSEDAILVATVKASDSTSMVYPYNRVLDGYFHDRTPSQSIDAGRIAFVPIITGVFCVFLKMSEAYNKMLQETCLMRVPHLLQRALQMILI